MIRKALKKYLFEFIVILLGVTISFAIEEYRSNREEKKIAREYLVSLVRELQGRTAETRKYLDYQKMLAASYGIILQNFETKTLSGDSLLTLIVSNEAYGNFDSRLGSWEALLSSGKIDAVDPDIIDSVNSLYKCYRDIEWNNKFNYDTWSSIWPRIAQDLPFNSYFTAVKRLHYGVSRSSADERLDRFFNNTLAIDYYHSKLYLAKYISQKYYGMLPAKEDRLITMLQHAID